jgi:hypothetical protein
MRIEADGLNFDFPDTWKVSKYDNWAFYRNQFSKIRDGIKAVDLIAVDRQDIWLIEVKDYRQFSRTKPSDLAEEVRDKVLYTLAAMLPAKINASDTDEQDFATKVLKGTQLHVILHLEQPEKHSKLFPRAINPINLEQKLSGLIKAIARPKVVESTNMRGLEWLVT